MELSKMLTVKFFRPIATFKHLVKESDLSSFV